MAGLLTYLTFVLLVALPVALGIKQVPARLRDLRDGIRGVCYVPLLWMLLFPAAAGAALLAELVPLLQWGWLGANIVVAPIADTGGSGGGAGGGSSAEMLYLAVFVPLAALAFLLFNYWEEQPLYRESYRGVFGWALLHLAMGIPLFAVIPIFAVGVGYKWLYDYRGQTVAYAAHVASNMGILALIVAGVLLGAV